MKPQKSKCAYCKKPIEDSHYHPFCSHRCQLSDLGRWLKGDYKIPGSAQSFVVEQNSSLIDVAHDLTDTEIN